MEGVIVLIPNDTPGGWTEIGSQYIIDEGRCAGHRNCKRLLLGQSSVITKYYDVLQESSPVAMGRPKSIKFGKIESLWKGITNTGCLSVLTLDEVRPTTF